MALIGVLKGLNFDNLSDAEKVRTIGGGAQLPPTCLLLLPDRQRPPQCGFRLTFVTQAQENRSPHTMQLGFKKPRVCCFGYVKSFVQEAKANIWLAEARMG